MNKKIATLLFICAAFLLNACQKNIDIFVPDAGQTNGADSTWYNTVSSSMPVIALRTSLSLPVVKDSFELSTSNYTTLTVNDAQFIFPPHCLVNAAGQVIVGKIYAEVQIIKKRGDMVLANKPTTSNGSILISAGEIFIALRKDGQELKIAPNTTIQIRYTDLPVNPSMNLFFGDESNPLSLNWVPNQDTINKIVPAQQVYEIITNHLRWINCDYFYDTTNIARSLVSAKLPSNYTNANTAAYLVFKDMRSVLAMGADVAERRFITGKVPNGKLATVVVISKQGNDYFLGKETITTGLNIGTTNVLKVTLSPVKTSLADIKLYLATL
jgi:hypothetical protein